MRLLEKASLDYAARLDPNSYNSPAKNKTVAIIGAGISGLACALRLCEKKYQVTVYEKSGRIGGHLWDILPPEVFLADIERQFMYEEYELCLNTEIRQLAELDFDAIYVATGAGSEDFGLNRSPQGAFASNIPGVFLGGELCGRNIVQAIADGLHVVKAIERYLKTGGMNQPSEAMETHLQLDYMCLAYSHAVIPADGVSYKQEEALQEARRCVKCSCDACLRHCDLMHYSQKTPKVIADQVEATINPGTLAGNGTIATRLISTCNQCGLCRKVCPQSIDVGDFLLQGHRAMREKEAMPWVFHDFWLRDMAFANGETAGLCRLPEGYARSRYLFFPGCQLGASDPRYVTESYRRLLVHNPDTALLLGCCGAPSDWAGDKSLHTAAIAKLKVEWDFLGKPTVIFACSTCKLMFQKYLPEVNGVFLYELLAKWGVSPIKAAAGEIVSVFDPCSSRDEVGLQQAIRDIVSKAGLKLEPLSQEGELARCCSWGGQVSIANPSFARVVVKARITENNNPYIAYCANCRDIFAAAKKPVYHILDILFGLGDPDRRPPTFSLRRSNRESLKRQMLQEFWKDEGQMEQTCSAINLKIAAELKQKLSDEMILESEIATLIEHCEKSGKKVFDRDAGHLVGHLKIGNMTYWAEYKRVDDGFELINAYCHRMSIEEA